MRFKEFLIQERTKADGLRDLTYDELRKTEMLAKKRGVKFATGKINDKTGEIHYSGPDALGRHQYGTFKKVKEEIVDEGAMETAKKHLAALGVAATLALSVISAGVIVTADPADVSNNRGIFSQIEKAAAQAEREKLKALQEKAKLAVIDSEGDVLKMKPYEEVQKELVSFVQQLQTKYNIPGKLEK
jgi:hypothetical protein